MRAELVSPVAPSHQHEDIAAGSSRTSCTLGAAAGSAQRSLLDRGGRIARSMWPELTGRALDQWTYGRGVQLRFTAPGKPIRNASAESFVCRLCDGCLNEY